MTWEDRFEYEWQGEWPRSVLCDLQPSEGKRQQLRVGCRWGAQSRGQNTHSRVDGQGDPMSSCGVWRGTGRPEVRLRRKVCKKEEKPGGGA